MSDQRDEQGKRLDNPYRGETADMDAVTADGKARPTALTGALEPVEDEPEQD